MSHTTSESKIISIITASRSISQLQEFKKNITETIGFPFEFLPFDNSKLQWGICKIYNHQAKLANGDIICFVHDDVRFVTENWGRELRTIFQENPKAGLVGLAGAGYKTKRTSTWSASPKELLVANVFEHKKYRLKESGKVEHQGNGNPVQQVVNIDGYFMSVRKGIFEKNPFDEKTLKGFHAYDIDYSMQIGLNHEILVAYSIASEHLSDGNPDIDWLMDAEKITKKWKKTLPRSIKKLTYWESQRQEYKAFFKASIIYWKQSSKLELMKYLIRNFSFAFPLIFVFKSRMDKSTKRLIN